MKQLAAEVDIQTGKKLLQIRNLLILSVQDVAAASGVSRNTLIRIEQGNGGNSENIGALILFYGYGYKDFYDFTKPLPTEDGLREQMEQFHKKNGSDSYKILYKQPPLIDLIEHKLLKTSLFDQWVTEKDVYKYCEEQFGYKYFSIPNTLTLATEKGFLKLRKGSSPKSYITSENSPMRKNDSSK